MLQLICILLLNIVLTQWVVKGCHITFFTCYVILQAVLIWQVYAIPNELLKHLPL